MRRSLVILGAALLLTLSPVVHAQTPPRLPLRIIPSTGSATDLQLSDFHYKGPFNLADAGGDTGGNPGMMGSWGAITTRTDSGDGLTLLITAEILGSTRVYEFKVPAVGTLTHDLRTTAVAPLMRKYSDTTNIGYPGYCTDFFAPNNCGGMFVMGISYVGNTFGNGHELILQYHQGYYVDAWEPSVYSAILSTDEASAGGFATSVRKGPWCSTEIGVGGRDAFAGIVPPGLAALAPSIAGKLLVGGDGIQVGAFLGFGANLYAFTHPPINTRDVPSNAVETASCTLASSIPLVAFTVANPMPRPGVVGIQGIACQNTDTNACGCYDSTGAFHQLSSNGADTWCKQLQSSPQVLRMGRFPDVGPYRQTPEAYPPYWGGVTGGAVNVPIMDRMNTGLVIETTEGKSAVLFASNVLDTIPGYPYPDPLNLGGAADEVWYGGPFTFDGARGVWQATGNGATTTSGYFTAFSESDIARVVTGAVPPHGISQIWSTRRSGLGGYNPVGTASGFGNPARDNNSQSLDVYTDLVLGPYQIKMAYDRASQLLFTSRPSTWEYGPYNVIPSIDVWQVGGSVPTPAPVSAPVASTSWSLLAAGLWGVALLGRRR